MESNQQATTGMVWYNYSPVDGLITGNAPVQVELGSVDIARQINQQVQLQYGSLQPVPTQAHQIIVTHQQHHHQDSVSESVSPEPPDSPRLLKHRSKSINGERVPCLDCGKTFSCNANLRDHMRLHTGERPFICTECGMSFAQRSNWRLHKRVHTGERPYMCGICGKTFSRSSHLPGHMRVHTGERPYQCDQCEHSFASAQALKNHARTHTGEKPFICEYCQTAFTHSSSLSSHKKRCTGEKRKRGRPLGSGRKSYHKNPTGRPRGRPKKKARYNKRGRKKAALSMETVTLDGTLIIKAEVHTHTDDSETIIGIPITKQEDDDSEVVEFDQQPVNLGQMRSSTEDVSIIRSRLAAQESISGEEVLSHESLSEEESISHHRISEEEVVSAAVAATGLGNTHDLHQEAAVAMAALHEGAALNLAHHHVTQNSYVEERQGVHAMWYPKQNY